MSNQLSVPKAAANAQYAQEILRAWAIDGKQQVIITRHLWNDPGAFGLFLVDLAKHVSGAYREQGADYEKTLARIKEGFDMEWADSYFG